MAPRLLHSRLDELGIDVAVCYPSVGLQMPAQRDEKLRRLGCRAYNRYAAKQFEGLGDRRNDARSRKASRPVPTTRHGAVRYTRS